MTKDYLDKLNDSILFIKNVCETNNACIECPMNYNCNEHPARWEAVDNGKEETT